MTALSHRRLRRRIEPYVDGELAPAARHSVRRHLDDCWGCSDVADVVRLIKCSLAHLADRRPPALAAVRLQRWARSVPDRLR
ncbi:MAG: zf-HC2 domain-containing protein [Acidimicrobiales bacterium]